MRKLGATLVLQEDLALIKELLCCDALHPQAVNGCLPCLQWPSAYGCFLRFWSEVVTMLAQHALCNIQDKALCSCKAKCHLSAHAVAARSIRRIDAQTLVYVSSGPVSNKVPSKSSRTALTAWRSDIDSWSEHLRYNCYKYYDPNLCS